MARSPILPIRLDDETKARWQAEADRIGCTLSELVRDAVEALLTAEAPRAGGRKAGAVKGRQKPVDAPVARSVRTSLCAHRVPAGSHCSRCDP